MLKTYFKYIFTTLVLVSSHKLVSACMCNVVDNNTIYYTSYMIADVKVLNIIADNNDKYLSTVEVEILNLIKGPKQTNFKIYDATRSYIDSNGETLSAWTSCSVTMKIGETYRVSPKFRNNNLIVDLCDYSPYHPKLPQIYHSGKRISVKNDTLDLKAPFQEFLTLPPQNNSKRDFAIVEFILNSDLSVKERNLKKNLKKMI